ncbi:Uma2 family endonuclease [Haliscomenobacter hydrossis]|uniref:Putative restriction endonuclease domain-containing protein n=1 Tax=Haliscomenobacter hydrossis (strain ATCC 27775 / DSM 1100 / LMG 10767 / O) TaxID=760192 RepID=F4L0C2_HALH1|nr:Uma2 family endonuclease [Haliscomenobacter hydrossis]AEE53795.1 protein of unknown function DUF820 [Haliscomenobacter hydrossis DSM 1100]
MTTAILQAEEKKYPITLDERLALGEGDLRYPGTMDDYVQLLEFAEYPVEYNDGEIIVMSIASDKHEQIVANILGALVNIFKGDPLYKKYGSNRHVFDSIDAKAWSPDASIVKGEPEIYTYKPGKTANLNPWLVVEILSKSTRSKDFGEKLPSYRNFSSMRYILFIDQYQPLVTLHYRSEEDMRWKSEDFNDLVQFFQIDDKDISLADIYENISF